MFTQAETWVFRNSLRISLFAEGAVGGDPGQPNILVLTVDDLGYGNLPAFNLGFTHSDTSP